MIFVNRRSIVIALINSYMLYGKWLDEMADIDIILFEFFIAFDAVSQDSLLIKLSASVCYYG